MANSWHVWHKRVRIAETPVGKGVFALRSFRRGQVIGVIQGIVCHDPEYGSPNCMDLGENRSLEPIPPFRYLNHNCEPNAEMVMEQYPSGRRANQLLLEAACDIAPNDEITIDYAWRAEDTIPCLCGSAKCRGWIIAEEDQHLLPPLSQVQDFSSASAKAMVAQPLAAAEMN